MDNNSITITGAKQNNLKGFSVSLPLNKLIVITGVSGSGKSSLAFDTIYSEGQRRYFETFSTYTRQFLDRMDKPRADRIEGIPPAIAIDQTNPVRTSRSTVGTMTELQDFLKLLFAKASVLFCSSCKKKVERDTPDTVLKTILSQENTHDEQRTVITFPVSIPHNFSSEEIKELLSKQGYHRIHRDYSDSMEVVQDRFVFSKSKTSRMLQALETAFSKGGGKAAVHNKNKNGEAKWNPF